MSWLHMVDLEIHPVEAFLRRITSWGGIHRRMQVSSTLILNIWNKFSIQVVYSWTANEYTKSYWEAETVVLAVVLNRTLSNAHQPLIKIYSLKNLSV